MSGSTPRRRHSPAVYRRRRLVALLALVAVVALVWLLIARPWQGSAAEGGTDAAPSATQQVATELPAPQSSTIDSGGTASPDPGASASASATPSETEASPVPSAAACLARHITVEAVTDQGSYGSGQQPQLSIRLTNTGEDCTMNVGTSSQVFTITSGNDTWWRSTDCQSEPSDMIVLLAAGQTVTSASPLTWDRTRSAVGTCSDTDRPAAPGGGASYHLTVEIGGIASTQATQFLLY